MVIINMKTILGFLLSLYLLSAQHVPELIEAGKKNAELQSQLWRKNLDEARQMSRLEKFEFLTLGLRNIGHQMTYVENRVYVEDVYKEIQSEFLNDNTYIDYFTNKIETERAKVAQLKYHSGERNSFNRMRVAIISDTLCHLPSPATVAALGKYLSDERDTPPPEYPGQDWGDAFSNAYQACSALEKIGLRNAQLPPRSSQNEANLATWRLWWGQVEAGTRAFSFEGEDVEYRFRKDGTWETSPLGNKSKSAVNKPAQTNETKSMLSSKSQWWYVVIGIVLGLGWLRWRKMRMG